MECEHHDIPARHRPWIHVLWHPLTGRRPASQLPRPCAPLHPAREGEDTAHITRTDTVKGLFHALLARARYWQRPAVAVLFDIPLATVEAQNASRDRVVRAHVVRELHDLTPTREQLLDEGFATVHLASELATAGAGRRAGRRAPGRCRQPRRPRRTIPPAPGIPDVPSPSGSTTDKESFMTAQTKADTFAALRDCFAADLAALIGDHPERGTTPNDFIDLSKKSATSSPHPASASGRTPARNWTPPSPTSPTH
ncbi:hypothetical protein [Streptomyces sp. CAU 1734]|uniref:hypothetical protein n=1 Tax=Streptomyces sp. CAU 1734 TaxID=3140360 RepID=UPI0032614C17